ncbi:MAG TPA: tetratricopeptide repeat-containing glycosyltransferase family protein [Thermoanaerobaculia bacterium]|nr:tetratricopeptide repeat-containing glycosyltransferase family protein [Thermoanaerobaculia bacterium]
MAAELCNRQGLDLMSQGNLEEALNVFRAGIEADPGYPENHMDAGAVLRLLARGQEAAEAFRKTLALRPRWPGALYNLGVTLLENGDVKGSIVALEDALSLDSRFSLAHGGLGLSLLRQQDLQGAKAAFQQALEIDPGLHLASHHLGMVHWLCREEEAAISVYREGLRRSPAACCDCHLALSLALLARGEYDEGWREYEWRWPCLGETPHLDGFDIPVWDGSPLHGKSIVLWPEQGLGDILMFVRFAKQVHDRGGEVWVLSRPNLDRLLATCPGVAGVTSEPEHLRDMDFQIPLGSLPRVLGIGLDELAAEGRHYLAPPEPFDSDPFGARHGHALRVGLVWAVEQGQPGWEERSCPLPLFRALESVPGVELYSLQFGSRSVELRQPGAPRTADLSAVLGDFASTAALIEWLDLIITVDTSMAHLAGAIGRPVWTLLHSDADWRWLKGREDSPWYPTLRLFRQTRPGDWQSVMERVVSALRELHCESSAA